MSGGIKFKLDPQDCDHGVPHKIVKRTLFHEHIRLRNC